MLIKFYRVSKAAGHRLGIVLAAIVTIIGALALAFVFGWKLALAISVASPVLVVAGYIQVRVQKIAQKKDAELMEAAGNVSVIRTLTFVYIIALTTLTILSGCNASYSEHKDCPSIDSRAHVFWDVRSPAARALQRSKETSIRLWACLCILSRRHFHHIRWCFSTWGFFSRDWRHDAYWCLQVTRQNRPTSFLKVKETIFIVCRVFFAIAFCAISVGQMNSYISEYSKAKMSAGLLIGMITRQPEIDPYFPGGVRQVKHFPYLFSIRCQ